MNPAQKAVRDTLIDELAPEFSTLIRRYEKYNDDEQRQQHLQRQSQQITDLQIELAKTRTALSETLEVASKEITILNKEVRNGKIWMWVGLIIGIVGLILPFFLR